MILNLVFHSPKTLILWPQIKPLNPDYKTPYDIWIDSLKKTERLWSIRWMFIEIVYVKKIVIDESVDRMLDEAIHAPDNEDIYHTKNFVLPRNITSYPDKGKETL